MSELFSSRFTLWRSSGWRFLMLRIFNRQATAGCSPRYKPVQNPGEFAQTAPAVKQLETRKFRPNRTYPKRVDFPRDQTKVLSNRPNEFTFNKIDNWAQWFAPNMGIPMTIITLASCLEIRLMRPADFVGWRTYLGRPYR